MTLPSPLKQLWSGWMAVSHAIGMVMSSIILTIMWVVIFGAYGIVLKLPALFVKKTKRDSFWWDVSGEQHDFRHQF